MNIGDLHKSMVMVEQGSGVIVSSVDEEWTYILTAKHVIEKTEQVEVNGKNLFKIKITYFTNDDDYATAEYSMNADAGVNYFPHQNLDIAILKIERKIIGRKEQPVIIDKGLPGDNTAGIKKFLKGFPQTRRAGERKLVYQIRDDEIGGFTTVIKDQEIEGKLIQNQSYEEIAGSSGGGIFGVHPLFGYAFLYGIQNDMPGNNNEVLANIRFTHISCFDSIIENYKDRLKPIKSDIIFDFDIEEDLKFYESDLVDGISYNRRIYKVNELRSWAVVKEVNKELFWFAGTQDKNEVANSVYKEIGACMFWFLKNFFQDKIRVFQQYFKYDKSGNRLLLRFRYEGPANSIPWEYLRSIEKLEKKDAGRFIAGSNAMIIKVKDFILEECSAKLKDCPPSLKIIGDNSGEIRCTSRIDMNNTKPSVLYVSFDSSGNKGILADEIKLDQTVLMILRYRPSGKADLYSSNHYEQVNELALKLLKANDYRLPFLISWPYATDESSAQQIMDALFDDLYDGRSITDSFYRMTAAIKGANDWADQNFPPVLYMNRADFRFKAPQQTADKKAGQDLKAASVETTGFNLNIAEAMRQTGGVIPREPNN